LEVLEINGGIKNKGFTLIELLVVIAIVALLMAILMPALQRIKEQAKAVACQAKLKQWCLVISLYTDDHNGSFHQGWTSSEGPKSLWMDAWLPYYKDGQLRLCPMATKPYTEGGQPGLNGAWGVHAPGSGEGGTVGGSGSYGINGWVNNPKGTPAAGRDPTWYWRTVNVKGASQVPVFLGAAWARMYVHQTDGPPQYEGETLTSGANRPIKNFCLNRHEAFVNGLFMDWTARKLGLKQLWTFKWHRNFDVNGLWTTAGGVQPSDWPVWMRNFRDY
jgi:prepilin-type N-terminal cleavage/methylation domain-containing protein